MWPQRNVEVEPMCGQHCGGMMRGGRMCDSGRGEEGETKGSHCNTFVSHVQALVGGCGKQHWLGHHMSCEGREKDGIVRNGSFRWPFHQL
eukprot:2846286-Rhodomonas_salina.1